jgi:hypothetical protein
MESTGADAVGAALVFLNLLERQPDRLAKFSLAEAKESPAKPHAAANMDIDRIGFARPAHG